MVLSLPVRHLLNRRDLVPLAVVLICYALILTIGHLIPPDAIRSFINSAGIFGPLVWFLVALLIYVVAPFNGSPILFIGFFAFGRTAIFYSATVGIVGSMINFSLARHFGRRFVLRLVSKRTLQHVDTWSTEHGFAGLLVLRVFESSMHEIISYAAGFTAIAFSEFIVATVIGTVISTAIWYAVSSYTTDPVYLMGTSIALSAVLSVSFFLLLGIHKILKRW